MENLLLSIEQAAGHTLLNKYIDHASKSALKALKKLPLPIRDAVVAEELARRVSAAGKP